MAASKIDERAAVILTLADLPETAEREACVVLAGVAVGLAGGDPEAAKEPLAEVLTAIGAIPYEPVVGLDAWGQRRNQNLRRGA